MKLGMGIILVLLALTFLSLGALSLTDSQIPAAVFGGKEQLSPGDWVKENQIQVFPTRVILNVPDATWAGFTNTNSMDPLLDEDANAIEVKPTNPQSIDVGDVISYHTTYGTVIHRVIEKGEDEQGVYYIVKGDNNRFSDPFKVYFKDVEGVVVAVIY